MKKTLVILGNGFDLNIGLRTSYRDFMNSTECHTLLKDRNNYLLNKIFSNFKLKNWIDLESELKKFAQNSNSYDNQMIEQFRIEYKSLQSALCGYLRRIELEATGSGTETPEILLKDSHAGKLLRFMTNYPERFEILTFNFTDLNRIAQAMCYPADLRYTHIHGSLAEENIIIGFEDSSEHVDKFCFMIKTFNNYYSGKKVRKLLDSYDDIIIFGHSLGNIDYPYFSKFFNDISSPDSIQAREVNLCIVTYNETSKLDILEQLRRMNDNRTNILFDQNKVSIICTQYYTTQCEFYHYLKGYEIKFELEEKLSNLLY